MDKKSNRRNFKRHPAQWKVAIVLTAPDGKPVIQHTQTIDLSLGGAAIVSEQGGQMGTVITLLLGQPPRRDEDRPKVIKAHARVVSSRKAPSGAGYHLGLSFVSQPGDELSVLADLIQEIESSQPPRRSEAAATESSEPITTNSRLARLKELAQTKLSQHKEENRDEINNRVSEALERAYRYLKELTQQLNVVKPAYDKGYTIVGVPGFAGLRWEAGNADFYTRQLSPAKQLYERVTLNFRLSGGKQVQVTVDSPANDRLKRLLTENRVEFTIKDALNSRGLIERSTFMLPCEVKASVLLQGNFETGRILLRTINVERFGVLEHQLDPAAITPDALEEFAGFIIGEEHQIGLLLLKSA